MPEKSVQVLLPGAQKWLSRSSGPPYDPAMLNILDDNENPALGAILGQLRSVEQQKGRKVFRQNVHLVGTLLAYEIAKSLDSKAVDVQTPLGTKSLKTLRELPILATALRAGMPFLDGMLDIYGEADTMFFGAARAIGAAPQTDGSLKIDMGYAAMSPSAGRSVIFVDPMIATGSTVVDVYRRLCEAEQTPKRFIVAGLVGWRGAYDRIVKHIPQAEVWFATCDEELDSHGYIVPGLGDAGDLCYGPKI
ncbi:MAG: uracil phosphoribosyltransferase [Planctomycetota bacterium]|jgi:uracil phosphoribosyltransferase